MSAGKTEEGFLRGPLKDFEAASQLRLSVHSACQTHIIEGNGLLYMKLLTSVSLITALVGIASSRTAAQGTFQDLDFEEATVVPTQFGISAAAAFPGWQVSLSPVSLDGLSTGGAAISLINDDPSVGATPLDGNYSAYLFGGGVPPDLYSASISQTGTVPPGTESIQLEAAYFGAQFTVSLGGQEIAMVQLQSFAHYELWGGNIPASMAGQGEALTIAEPPPSGTPPSGVELDDISFSPTAVIPEPNPLALIGVAGALFAAYRRFAPKRQ